MAKKRAYDETSVVRSLSKKNSIRVNTVEKVVEVMKGASDVGNGSWGKIDYLHKVHGYVYVFVTSLGKKKVNNTDDDSVNIGNNKTAKREAKFNMATMRKISDTKARFVGMGMAMQGSGISGVDVGSATLKLNDEGVYTMNIGAADMGTGCDTILAQIAAEVLECSTDDISVFGADTDISPYDSGSYASSTTYVTGKAVENCALELRSRIEKLGAKLIGCDKSEVTFDGSCVRCEAGEHEGASVSLCDIATASMCGNDMALSVTNTHTSPISPPPFMVGAAEVEVDLVTGESRVVEYDACVDCGTPVNPNLARVQAEGGILQGIGMAMSENITYSDKGKLYENSFLQYKIPSRMDIGHINVEFESSFENAGPFGAKSIGEVVINTPLPAVTDALSHAAGKRFYELPITPEQIAMARVENN